MELNRDAIDKSQKVIDSRTEHHQRYIGYDSRGSADGHEDQIQDVSNAKVRYEKRCMSCSCLLLTVRARLTFPSTRAHTGAVTKIARRKKGR